MKGMTIDNPGQPTPREILDAVLQTQDVMASAIGRIELDLGSVKSDVAIIKADISRLERRVIRIDDRLAVIENINPGPMLADHERRIARLEGF